MWSIAVVIACTYAGQCQPFVGEHMTSMQCRATSMIMLSDFHRQYPKFDPKKSRIMCVEPRRLKAVLGRNIA